MRRIYITAIPFHQNYVIKPNPYHPVNFSSSYEGSAFSYVIVPAIAESMQEGDSGKVVVIHQTDGMDEPNLQSLRNELASVGHGDIEIVPIAVKESQDADLLIGLFRMLADEMEDNACYYADITFGPKSFAIVIMAGLSYADNIMENTVIRGIYYQEIQRKQGQTVAANAYNMEELYSLSSLMGMVSGQPVQQRKDFIAMLVGEEE